MTLTNREVFDHDPTEGDIPNLGVAKVKNPEDAGRLGDARVGAAQLRLRGRVRARARADPRPVPRATSARPSSRRRGSAASSAAASPTSCACSSTSGATTSCLGSIGARSSTQLPLGHRGAPQRALDRRQARGRPLVGSRHARVGRVGLRAARVPGVVFDAAGLPQQYAPARLAIWMRQEGLLRRRSRPRSRPRASTFDHELRNLYVSPVLAQALIDAGASFGDTPGGRQRRAADAVPDGRRHQQRRDARHASRTSCGSRARPHGQAAAHARRARRDAAVHRRRQRKALNVQDLVEGCSSRVREPGARRRDRPGRAHRQPDAAEAHRPVLGHGRAVRHRRRDRRPQGRASQEARRASPTIEATLDKVSGEIDRHLGGTRLEAKARRQGRPRGRLPAASDPSPLLGARPARDRQGRQGRRAAHPAEDRPRGSPQRRRPARSARHRRRLRLPLRVGQHAAERRAAQGDRRADPRPRRRLRRRRAEVARLRAGLPDLRSFRTTASATPAFARRRR